MTATSWCLLHIEQKLMCNKIASVVSRDENNVFHSFNSERERTVLIRETVDLLKSTNLAMNRRSLFVFDRLIVYLFSWIFQDRDDLVKIDTFESLSIKICLSLKSINTIVIDSFFPLRLFNKRIPYRDQELFYSWKTSDG